MYKIMILGRDNSRTFWNFYQERKTIEVSPPEFDPADSTVIIKPAVTESRMCDYETEELDDAEEKVKTLLASYTTQQIRVVKDMSYQIDLLFD